VTNETGTLVVSEVFGPTIQGEGPSLGRRAGFIRLGGCNLTCSWCDAAYTWNASRYDLRAELTRMPVTAMVERALVGDPEIVVITGGEPLLHQQQAGWSELLDQLWDADVSIEVETNGTIAPEEITRHLVTQFNVSPKLAHNGDPLSLRLRPEPLRALVETNKAVFKFVCGGVGDVHEVSRVIDEMDIPRDLVWIMPLGVTAEEVNRNLRSITPESVNQGFNVTTRLHIYVWGDERAH
jgi:7-carboxy-7-deazaguanine synthase